MLICTIHNYHMYFSMLFGQSLNSLLEIDVLLKRISKGGTQQVGIHTYLLNCLLLLQKKNTWPVVVVCRKTETH